MSTDLPPQDSTLPLPNGPRWIECAALAEVARHVGGLRP
jgi:hypothetical protein